MNERARKWLIAGGGLGVLAVAGVAGVASFTRWRERTLINNEMRAIGWLRTVDHAQSLFRETDKEADGYLDYGTLAELVATGALDDRLASGTQGGYVFEATYGAQTSEFLWYAVANPIEPGVTGARSFVINHKGRVNETREGPLGLNSLDCRLPEGVTDSFPSIPDDRPGEPPLPDPEVLAHVAVGQRYRFRIITGEQELKVVYTVVRVRPLGVDYEVQTTMDQRRVGDPSPMSWEVVLGLYESEDQAVTDRILELGGRTWTCRVTTFEDRETWVPVVNGQPTFPPVIRSLRGDAITMELVSVEELSVEEPN